MYSETRGAPTTPAKVYTEIVADILDRITKGITKERHVYLSSQTRYQLASRSIEEIVSVEGTYRGERHVFEKGTDYQLSQLNSSVLLDWNGRVKPDDGTYFRVSYIFGNPSELSDTSPGSVLRTIVESIGKELALLYEEMDQVYRSGFIDTAKGNSLDFVASLIGVHRKQPTRAMGFVTFWRDSDPPETSISGEAILFDGRDSYPLKNAPVKLITSVSGVVTSIQYSFTRGKDYDVDTQSNSIIWLLGGSKPDLNTPFSVDYVVYERIVIPKGSHVSTFGTKASSPKLFETMEEAALQKSQSGKWEADVQVRALESGHEGNVGAGAITLMPNPAIGVEHVINRSSLAGGADHEEDDSLRARAKKALEVAGKATIGSLRTALEGIEGLQSAPLITENPDGIPGLTKVVIDGGDEKEIQRVIEETRAAGIKVEFSRPKPVMLDFELLLVPKKTAGMTSSKAERDLALDHLKIVINSKVKNFVSSLRIGDDLIYNQLLSTILATESVHDVKLMTVAVYRDGIKVTTSSKENIAASEDERLYPRTVEVTFDK